MKNHGGEPIIPFSGVFESKLVDMPEDERDKYCKEVGATSAIDKIVTTGFRAIQLIYFFTAGADEVKCWQIRRHTKAPQVGGYTTTDSTVCIDSCGMPSRHMGRLGGVRGHRENFLHILAWNDANSLGTLRQRQRLLTCSSQDSLRVSFRQRECCIRCQAPGWSLMHLPAPMQLMTTCHQYQCACC